MPDPLLPPQNFDQRPAAADLTGTETTVVNQAGVTVKTTAQAIANLSPPTDLTGTLQKAANLSDLPNVATARTNLGLKSAALRDVGTGPSNVLAVGPDGSLPPGLTPSAPTTGLVLAYPMDDGTGSQLTNSRRAKLPGANLFVFADLLSRGDYWGGAANFTNSGALSPFGTPDAFRWNAPAGNQYTNQLVTFIAGHTYTIGFTVQNNKATAQTFRCIYNYDFHSWDNPTGGTLTVGPGWTSFSATFVASGSFTVGVGIANDGTSAVDVNICGAYCVESPIPIAYESATGNLTLTGATARVTGGVDFSGGGFALGSVPPTALSRMTVYVPFKWPIGNSTDGTAGLLGSKYGSPGFTLLARNGDFGGPSFNFNGTRSTSGANSTQANFHDGLPHIAAGVYDGSTVQLWLDDVQMDATAPTVINPAILDVIQMATANLTVGQFTGTIYGTPRIYSLAHTPAQMARVRAQMIAEAAINGVTIPSVIPKLVVFDGDSISAGSAGSSFVPVAMAGIAPIVQGRNFAVPGSVVSGNANSMAARAPLVNALYNSARARNVLFAFSGRNDYGNYSGNPAGFVAALKTYCLAQRSAGWKICLATVLPASQSGFNAWRNAVNALIRADTSFYDQLADFGANPLMGIDSAPGPADSTAATTYYLDGTHPTQAGSNLLGPIAAAAITAALS